MYSGHIGLEHVGYGIYKYLREYMHQDNGNG